MIDKAKGHGIDFSQRRVAVVHSYGADAVDELKALVQKELGPKEIIEGLIGPTVGTHAGPGGLAVFFRLLAMGTLASARSYSSRSATSTQA